MGSRTYSREGRFSRREEEVDGLREPGATTDEPKAKKGSAGVPCSGGGGQ